MSFACVRIWHLQVDKGLNVLEFHEKPPRKVLATMSIDTLEYGFGESGGLAGVGFPHAQRLQRE